MFWLKKMIFLVGLFWVLLLPCFAHAVEVKTLEIGKSTPDFNLPGILGHVEDADVEWVLEENLNGLRNLNLQLVR